MVNVNELRIGSLVNHNRIQKQDKTAKVSGILSNGSIWVIYSYIDQFGNKCINEVPCSAKFDLAPIILTEELLFELGFIKSKSKSDCFLEIAVGGSGLLINPDNGIVWIMRNDNIFNPPALIRYVHQLQNLYSALTGLELNFKD